MMANLIAALSLSLVGATPTGHHNHLMIDSVAPKNVMLPDQQWHFFQQGNAARAISRPGPTHCRPPETQFSGGWIRPDGPGEGGSRSQDRIYSICVNLSEGTVKFVYGQAGRPEISFQSPRDGRFMLWSSVENEPGFYSVLPNSSELYFTKLGVTYQLREYILGDNGSSFERVTSGDPRAELPCYSCRTTPIQQYAALLYHNGSSPTLEAQHFLYELPRFLGTDANVVRNFSQVRLVRPDSEE